MTSGLASGDDSNALQSPRIVFGPTFPVIWEAGVLRLPQVPASLSKNSERLGNRFAEIAVHILGIPRHKIRHELAIAYDDLKGCGRWCVVMEELGWENQSVNHRQAYLRACLLHIREMTPSEPIDQSRDNDGAVATEDRIELASAGSVGALGLGDPSANASDEDSNERQLVLIARNVAKKFAAREGALHFGDDVVVALGGKEIPLPPKTQDRPPIDKPPFNENFRGIVDSASYRRRTCEIADVTSRQSHTFSFVIEEHLRDLLQAEMERFIVEGICTIRTLTDGTKIREISGPIRIQNGLL